MSIKVLSAKDKSGITETIGVYTNDEVMREDMIIAQETEYKCGGWLSFVVEERQLNNSRFKL